MPKLNIDVDFLQDYAKLDRPVRKRVEEVFGEFSRATHTGLHLEPISGLRDQRFWSIRIDQFWRGVALDEGGGSYVLLKVLPHNDAYDWARRRRASVNAASGRLEIRDVASIDDSIPKLERIAAAEPKRLFDGVNDADMRRLGIDDQMLAFARALTEESQLTKAGAYLPSEQYTVLVGLASGMTPEDVWQEVASTVGVAADKEFDPDDVTAAIERSHNRVLLVEGPEELMTILRRPFESWQVYLHPLQHEIAQADYRGPARVTGGPGTGKTVVLLHRARQLAERGDGRVLLTAFNRTMVGSLQASLALLIDDQRVRDRIEVLGIDQLANRIFRAEHGRPDLLRDHEERQIWRTIIDDFSLPEQFTESFLSKEWRQVVLAQEVDDAQDYLVAKRNGRGRGLGRLERAHVWQAIWRFQEELRDRGKWTHETVTVEATRLLTEQSEQYRHVLVDEAQDLSPMAWRLLRAAAPEADNDLFLAGDPHQRIYEYRVSLRDVGIHIVGRSTKLGVNYRTTSEILEWSLEMLRGEQIDDMDGALDSIAGCHSQLHGDIPTLAGFPERAAELAALGTQVKAWIEAGVAPGEIGVAAPTRQLAYAARKSLMEAGSAAFVLSSRGEVDHADGGVAAGTMHSMKGLEFRCLAVVGVSEEQVPQPGAMTSIEEDRLTHEHDMQRARCLLFVACTRARERLAVSWHGSPSELLSPHIATSSTA